MSVYIFLFLISFISFINLTEAICCQDAVQHIHEGACCGKGPCNIFCCNCDYGCSDVEAGCAHLDIYNPCSPHYSPTQPPPYGQQPPGTRRKIGYLKVGWTYYDAIAYTRTNETYMREIFLKLDKNRDGFLSIDEADQLVH